MKINFKAFYVLVFIFVVSCTPEQLQQFHYTLTTDVSPAKSGIVAPGSAVVTSGSYINLTAAPSQHYYFKGWYGFGKADLLSVENPVLVFMNADQYFMAVFELKDTDNDGVTDDIDECPNTPEGEAANEKGCSPSQTDQDGDGVMDDVDICVDTPEGEYVDEKGCSDSQKDTDLDGVTDDMDECPDTPEVESVDEYGCSDSQKDTDEDGVTDDIDECPDTEYYETPDEHGCADSQKDTDGDGVTDDVDQCPDTPQDHHVDVNQQGCPVVD